MTVRARLAALLGLVVACALVTPGAAVLAKSGSAAGVVKIDGIPFDDYPNDEPHVGCVFDVDFSGFAEGDLFADVTFSTRPPSGTTTLLQDEVFIGEDPAGGATDLDATVTYDLSELGTDGAHVKLTVVISGRAKHKTFWLEDC